MKIYKLAQSQAPAIALQSLFDNVVKKGSIVWKQAAWGHIPSMASAGLITYTKDVLGTVIRGGVVPAGKIDFIVRLFFLYENQGAKLYRTTFELLANHSSGLLALKKYTFDSKNPYPNPNNGMAWKDFLKDRFGITIVEDPIVEAEQKKAKEVANPTTPIKAIKGIPVFFYHRLTRMKTSMHSASQLEVVITKTKMGSFQPAYLITDLEDGNASELLSLGDEKKNFNEAIEEVNKYIGRAKLDKNGYVDKDSVLYIPEGANDSNWDFVLNRWKASAQKPAPSAPKPETKPETPSAEKVEPPKPSYRPNLKKLISQTNQDFGGYYSGQIPDYAGSLVGSSSVDASQISTSFGSTQKAIQMVNNYDSSLLKNIAFIFNFSKAGAYGVYLPALDRAIKTKALQKRLEAQGYVIKEENGLLTAHPTEKEKSNEEIDKDIERLYNEINQGGGTALGINMSNVMAAANEDAARMQSPDPNIGELLAILHLGETIVHEAAHSKGVMDEGGAQNAEMGFANWALPQINDEYRRRLQSMGKEDEYSPIIIGTERRHANSDNWYKIAQSFMPSSIIGKPYGSDLSGRYRDTRAFEDQENWTMLSRQTLDTPIEKRLGRQYMAALPKGLSQEHDTLEMQLRKYREGNPDMGTNMVTEMLLSEEHNDNASYKTMESLLEETRPYPLMLPIKKDASSKLIKEATLFGWYNNLSISDGSTIPGLGDRVMAWDDRDEDFSQEEEWIEKQFRYNPTYDIKGMYYRWIEPRFQPTLFDDMTRDYSNTAPAKRFAAQVDPDIVRIMSILKAAVQNIKEGSIKGTRLIASEDIVPLIEKLMSGEQVNIKICKFGETEKNEDLFAVWIYGEGVSEESIEKAEDYFENKDLSDDVTKVREMVEDILRDKANKTTAIQTIVKKTQEVCKKYGIEKVYILGSYARQKAEGVEEPSVQEINFASDWTDQLLKIGNIVAKELGAISLDDGRFVYRDIRFDFGCGFNLSAIMSRMQENSINTESHLLCELCNRDFTVNMLAYNVIDDRVEDPMNVMDDLRNKTLRTLFDANFVLETNPLIITRVLQMAHDGYVPDDSLQMAMIESLPLLFRGQSLEGMRKYVEKNISDEDSHIKQALSEMTGGGNASSHSIS